MTSVCLIAALLKLKLSSSGTYPNYFEAFTQRTSKYLLVILTPKLCWPNKRGPFNILSMEPIMVISSSGFSSDRKLPPVNSNKKRCGFSWCPASPSQRWTQIPHIAIGRGWRRLIKGCGSFSLYWWNSNRQSDTICTTEEVSSSRLGVYSVYLWKYVFRWKSHISVKQLAKSIDQPSRLNYLCRCNLLEHENPQKTWKKTKVYAEVHLHRRVLLRILKIFVYYWTR